MLKTRNVNGGTGTELSSLLENYDDAKIVCFKNLCELNYYEMCRGSSNFMNETMTNWDKN